jgi:hypothetical protein
LLVTRQPDEVAVSVAFQIVERFVGFAVSSARSGEQVSVLCAESLTSLDGVHLTWRLEQLHNAIFSKVPGLPPPNGIDSLLIIIKPDLSAVAYVNEIKPTVSIAPARPMAAGEPVLVMDILDVLSFDIGVEVPWDCGVILLRTHGWRKALFYDLCPLGQEARPRTADISSILAKQTLSLLRGQFAGAIEQKSMRTAIEELEGLIGERCNDESQYQELLIRRPWLLGGLHTRIDRHTSLDDRNVPDFTGVRAADSFRDIFEIKPPFMPCFRQDDGFTATFNDAWTQAERYLSFARQQRQYLRDKGLLFENPRCFLLIGYGLSEQQLQALRIKESFNPAITVLTYEQVIAVAKAFLATLETASAP